MFDHGVYALNTFRWLTGEEPSGYLAAISTPDHDGRFNEVEENVQWITRFPSGALCSGAASYGVELGGYWRAHGPWGFLQMNSLTYQGQHLVGRYASVQEVGAPWIEVDIASQEKDPMQFTRQVDHLSDCILRDRTPDTPGEDGLADLRAVEGVYKAAGVTL